MIKKLKNYSERQSCALQLPVDMKKHDLDNNHHREIGFFSTIFSIDIEKNHSNIIDSPFIWHVSVALPRSRIIGSSLVVENDHLDLPCISLFMWSDKAWKDAIDLCKKMLIPSLGEGEPYWLGEVMSLHYIKGLSQKERLLLYKLNNWLPIQEIDYSKYMASLSSEK